MARLTDREGERDVLDRLVDAVRAGESQVLIVRGDPGAGKTALLDYLAEGARGCRIARATGVQSELELAFAGLHQLCAPMLDHLDRIPVPQRDALRTAFGIAAGSAPDRFLVGLTVLSLLAEVSGDQPLICLVDDVQWLDCCAHNFRILDSACHNVKRGVGDIPCLNGGKSGAASGCRERLSA